MSNLQTPRVYTNVRWTENSQWQKETSKTLMFIAYSISLSPIPCFLIDESGQNLENVTLQVMIHRPGYVIPVGTQFQLSTVSTGKINIIAEGVVVEDPKV